MTVASSSVGFDQLHRDVSALLRPASVVVFGASPRNQTAIENVLRAGFPVSGVHPTRTQVAGVRCVPDVSELLEPPQVALMLVGHARLESAVQNALTAGVRAFVIPGLGNEAGADRAMVATRVGDLVAEAGAAMLGPNCMGIAAPETGSMWLGTIPETFLAGHVGVVSQSGSIGEAFVGLGPRIGFRAVVSTGGEATRDAADFVAAFAAEDETRALGLFLETVRRPDAFASALATCAERDKPVVCLKVGRSQLGARAALAHSGALVGSDRAFSALLRRHNVIEVDDFHDFVETLEVLGRRRRPVGTRLAAISESGGECALLADCADIIGCTFPPLPEPTAAQLRTEFPNYPLVANPLDAWAVDVPEKVYPRSIELIADSGAFDVLLAQIDLSQFRGQSEAAWCEMIVRALAERASGVFCAVASVGTCDPPAEIAATARLLDIPLLRGTAQALRALTAVARWRPAEPPTACAYPRPQLGELPSGALPEHESAEVLAAYGVPVALHRRVHGAEQAAVAAEELGFPVVVKVDGPAHKSGTGGVVLDIQTRDEVVRAAKRLGERVLVARQIPAGDEYYCGMARDPSFGPILAAGRGGVYVEQGRPRVCSAPLGPQTAKALALEAGAPPQLADVLLALSRIATDHPQITEIDINPLIHTADGLTAVDALIVTTERTP